MAITIQRPMFGWSAAKPPQNYTVKLEPGDLRGLYPTASLVEKLAQRLIRGKSDKKPGFAVISETRHLFGTKERVLAFQMNLMSALKKYLQSHQPELLNLPSFAVRPDSGEKWKTVVDTFSMRGHGEAGHLSSKWRTIKKPHFDDFTDFQYISMVYGPYRNIAGGVPMLFDVRQFAKDHDLPTQGVLNLQKLQGGAYGKVKSVYFRDVVKKYGFAVKGLQPERDFPIVIFSNRLEDGVAHGATKVLKADPDKIATRRLQHASIGQQQIQ